MKNETELTSSHSDAAESRPLPETTKSAPAPRWFTRKPLQGSRSHKRLVTIEANIDVGFGNALYLRGEGTGLSWNAGVPLKCVDGSTWKWSGETDRKLKFKLLLNDSVWSKGEDLVAAPGEKVKIAPAF